MTLSAKSFEIGQRANATLMAVLAYTTLVLVFVLDAVTPQTLSIEIAYEGSVVIAALSGSRHLVRRVLSVTLLSDVLGGMFEAVQEGVDLIGIENRILSLISIFMVGALVLSVRTKGEESGRVWAQTNRQRLDGMLVRALDRFWSSLEPGQIARAITEEARTFFDAAETIWCPNDRDEPLLRCAAPSKEATACPRPPAASAASAALFRLASLHDVATLSSFSGLTEIGGRSASGPYYLAIPLETRHARYGVLLVSAQAQFADAETLGLASQFAVRALAGMQQAHLSALTTIAKRA